MMAGKESGWIIPIENIAKIKDNLPNVLNFKYKNNGTVSGNNNTRIELALNSLILK
jgi:hypothetical protein